MAPSASAGSGRSRVMNNTCASLSFCSGSAVLATPIAAQLVSTLAQTSEDGNRKCIANERVS
jgi:hypothetical protein